MIECGLETKSSNAILWLLYKKSLRGQFIWMHIATSMMGKHYKNDNKKLIISMKQTIVFTLYPNTEHPGIYERNPSLPNE